MQVFDPASEFTRSLPKILVHEGLYSNHPDDPGGATMKGVTQRVFTEYLAANGKASRDVRTITDDELQAIYRKRYWDIAKLDKLAPGVSYVVFDGNVNSGVSQSVKWLQRALQAMGLYQGAIDGIIGQGTILAAAGVNDNDALIAKIIQRREAFLRQLTTFKTFGKGWLKRLADVKAVGQAWATGTVGPEIRYVPGGDAKAFLSSAKPAPALAVADAATGSGIGSGTLTLALQQAQEQLAPYSAGSELIGKVMAGLIIAGTVLTVGGLAYRWYAARRRKRRADALDLQTTATAVQAPA